MNTKLYKNWRLLIETAVIVVGIVLVKVLFVEQLSLEFFTLSPLFTSIIAGGIFVVSILLAGVIADYKESDKVPSEISAAIEAIYEDGMYVKEIKPKFNLILLRQRLQGIIHSLKVDLESEHGSKAIAKGSLLSQSFLEMERLGIPANYIVRLKQEQSIIRKTLLRIHHIQLIRFAPSAYILLKSFVTLIIALLIFTKIEPLLDSLILVSFVSYLFIYLIKLIHTIDNPFCVGDDTTMDEISFFLLRESHERIGKNEKI
jgi:hypothetical protein